MNLRRQKLSQAASLSAERCLKNPMPPQQVVDLQMLALRHAATPLSTADHPIAAEHGDYVMNVVRRRVRQTVERRHRGLLQKQPGIAVAYVTDTRPCDGGRTLAENADLLYHDATFTDTFHARAVETGHSTAREAAEVARDAEARRLLLGHISARYDDPTPIEAEAKSVFPASRVAEELRRYSLDPREKESEASRS